MSIKSNSDGVVNSLPSGPALESVHGLHCHLERGHVVMVVFPQSTSEQLAMLSQL
jgi:hypothetical protein